MESNISIKKPDWLTDEVIKRFRTYLQNCPNPYTDEEFEKLPFDDLGDADRRHAHLAKKILTKYGLL